MPLKTIRDDQVSLNLTPMIDIIFLLLIFFVVTSRYNDLADAERDLSLHVPQVASMGVPTAAREKRLINVFADGHVELDGTPAPLDQLAGILTAAREQNPQTGVVVRGDANSPYQKVAEVIAACHQAQITDLNVAVRVASLEH